MRVILFLLVAHFFSMLWAVSSFRGLYSDGAYWYVDLVARMDLNYEPYGHRNILVLGQLPAWLWYNLWEQPAGAEMIRLFFLPYGLYPFLSLLGVFWILRRANRLELFFFPVVSFALSTHLVMAMPSSHMLEIASLFWPLFFLAALPSKHRFLDGLLCVPLIIGFVLGHEAAILLTVFLAIVAAVSQRFVLASLLLAASLTLGFYLWYSPLLAPYLHIPGDFQNFVMGNLYWRWELFGKYSALTTAVIVAATAGTIFAPLHLHEKVNRTWAWVVGILSIVYAVTALAQSQVEAFAVYELIHSRVLVVPVCLALAVSCWVCLRRNRLPEMRQLKIVLVIVLAAALVNDLQKTIFYRSSYKAFTKLMNENPGCNVIEQSDYHLWRRACPYFPAWILPYLSLSIASQSDSKLNSIFLTETPLTGRSCNPIEGLLYNQGKAEVDLEVYGAFDFGKVLEGPIRLHVYDKTEDKISVVVVDRPK